jgi:hypothetical protein
MPSPDISRRAAAHPGDVVASFASVDAGPAGGGNLRVGTALAAALGVLPRLVRGATGLAAATVIGVIWPIETAAVIMARAVEGEGSGRTWTLSDPSPVHPPTCRSRRRVAAAPGHSKRAAAMRRPL